MSINKCGDMCQSIFFRTILVLIQFSEKVQSVMKHIKLTYFNNSEISYSGGLFQ